MSAFHSFSFPAHLLFVLLGLAPQRLALRLFALALLNGSPKYDLKNKDEKLRKVRADQVVVVWGVRYDAEEEEWSGGRVYNPASGKNYNCTISFEGDGKTLRVKGSWGPVSLSRYWKKIE